MAIILANYNCTCKGNLYLLYNRGMNKQIYAALQQAIDDAGGAEQVGILVAQLMERDRPYTRQAVENWYRNIAVPAEVVPALSVVVKLSRGEIRPDLWEAA